MMSVVHVARGAMTAVAVQVLTVLRLVVRVVQPWVPTQHLPMAVTNPLRLLEPTQPNPPFSASAR
jgi:hypothetical protein